MRHRFEVWLTRQMIKCPALVLIIILLIAFSTFGNIHYPDFGSTDGLVLNGSARQSGILIQMTPAQKYQRASIWFGEKQYIQDGFETTFQFQIKKTGAVSADAIVFVIQNDNREAIGSSGGHLGYGYSDGWETTHEGEDRAIKNSLAIEFDTFENIEFGDPNNNHISIHTNGKDANSSDHRYSLGSETELPSLSDGEIHAVKITYVPGELRVYLDEAVEPVLVVSLILADTLNLSSGEAWLGFTAATGGAVQNTNLISWTAEAEKSPAPFTSPYYLLESVSPYTLGNLRFQIGGVGGYESGHIADLVAIPTAGIGLLNWFQISVNIIFAGFIAQEEFRFAGFEIAAKARLLEWGEENSIFAYLKYKQALGEPIIAAYEGEIIEVGAVVSPRADTGIDIIAGVTGRLFLPPFALLFDGNYSRTELRDYYEEFTTEGYKNRVFINAVPALYLGIIRDSDTMIGLQNRITFWMQRGFMYDLMPQITWKPFQNLLLSLGVGIPVVGGNVYKAYFAIMWEFP